MRLAACCATRKPPKADTVSACATASGSRSTRGPRSGAAGVVHHDVGAAPSCFVLAGNSSLNLIGLTGVAGHGDRASRGGQLAQLFDVAALPDRRAALPGKQPRQRRAEPVAGTYDQGGPIVDLGIPRGSVSLATCGTLAPRINAALQPAGHDAIACRPLFSGLTWIFWPRAISGASRAAASKSASSSTGPLRIKTCPAATACCGLRPSRGYPPTPGQRRR